jgi:hypothetical protein
VLVALLLIWWRFQKQINAHLPAWVGQAALSLLHGKAPQLSPGQVSLLVIAGIVSFVALFFLAFLLLKIRSRLGGSSLYDRRLVEEKTARPAYRVRLRLFVFSSSPDPTATASGPSWRTFTRCLFQWPLDIASLRNAYQSWRTASRRQEQERATHVQVLEQLAAAYRQYHTASGGYFVPRRLSQRKGKRIFSTQRAHLPGWAKDVAGSSHRLSVADLAALCTCRRPTTSSICPTWNALVPRLPLACFHSARAGGSGHRAMLGIPCRFSCHRSACATTCWR